MTIGKEDFSIAIEECIQRWPKLKDQVNVYYSHLNFIRLDVFEGICHRFIEDFRSMPLPKDFKEAYSEWKEKRSLKEPQVRGKDNFMVHFRVNCRECGKMNVTCIEEPIGSELICRECYTGLTDSQITQRYKDLIKMMKYKDFTPDWVKDLEVPF